MKAGTGRDTTMLVTTERTTTSGNLIEKTLCGERLVNPPGAPPRVDGDDLLGTVTSLKELDGGQVTLVDCDEEIQAFSSVLDVTQPPMSNKAKLTFIAEEPELVAVSTILHAKASPSR